MGLALVATIAASAGCDDGTRTSTGSSAGDTIERVFQAHLPESAKNMRVESAQLMNLVVYGAFECSNSDLSQFLEESKLLPDELTRGLNPLAGIQGLPSSWDLKGLKNVSGTECLWEDGESIATCDFAAGLTGDGSTIVYFMVVYEHRNAAGGLRPDTKTDPNWRN